MNLSYCLGRVDNEDHSAHPVNYSADGCALMLQTVLLSEVFTMVSALGIAGTLIAFVI